MTVNGVLLVDDSPDDNYLHARILQRVGVVGDEKQLFVCSGGAEALRFLADREGGMQKHGDAFPPDLILLDINMPGVDAWAFLERFAELPDEITGSVVIIMLTSSIAPEDRARAEANPLVRGFVTKPLRRENVEDLVARHFSAPE